MVNEIKQQKEAAENAAKLLAQRELDLKRKNEEMNDAIAFLEAEKAKLQGEIWALEDQLSLARQTISDMRSGK